MFLPFRCSISVFIVLFVEPQTPKWSPLITRIRNLFLTYESAKIFIEKMTWIAIGVFYSIHAYDYVFYPF
uniref:Uncharacterized protein n=1 Tax=Pseudochlorodesmis sp. HV01306b TaxID=2358489 RepID=A0A386AYC1_9CHLO|nr:hypothetical protein Ycf47 [Pseudochlorodesmis sp. HV01306b]